jgi:hypothetical protein
MRLRRQQPIALEREEPLIIMRVLMELRENVLIIRELLEGDYGRGEEEED